MCGLLPIIRPTLPPLAEVEDLVRASWESGIVTVGPTVRAFEEEVCRRTGARYAVAFSSCTAALMLTPQALRLPLGSQVIIPSFTFAATAQALVWNGLIPVFCDCLPGTCTLDPEDVERNLSVKTAAICPVYIYGLPPEIDALLNWGGGKVSPCTLTALRDWVRPIVARLPAALAPASAFPSVLPRW